MNNETKVLTDRSIQDWLSNDLGEAIVTSEGVNNPLDYTVISTQISLVKGEIPESISELQNLVDFTIYGNKLKQLPIGLTKLKKLEQLKIINIKGIKNLDEIVEGLTNCPKLNYLALSGLGLKKAPIKLDQLKQIKILGLTNNKLSTLNLDAKNLTHLNLSKNCFSEFPKSIYNTQNIERLTFEKNPLKDLSFLKSFKKIKIVSIDMEQCLQNIEFLKSLDSLTQVIIIVDDGGEYSFEALRELCLSKQTLIYGSKSKKIPFYLLGKQIDTISNSKGIDFSIAYKVLVEEIEK